MRGHSYFQDEVELDAVVPRALLEDEVWNLIRIGPDRLPTGSIKIIPSMEFIRLHHEKQKPQKAAATLTEKNDETLFRNPFLVYRIEYRNLPRSIEIYFRKVAPFRILGWNESFYGEDREQPEISTTAIKTHSMITDYWNQNRVEDTHLRQALGLR